MSGGTADGDQQCKFVTHSSQGVGLVLPTGRSGITIDATTYATMLFTKEYTKYQHCEYGEGQSHVRSQGPASPNATSSIHIVPIIIHRRVKAMVSYTPKTMKRRDKSLGR